MTESVWTTIESGRTTAVVGDILPPSLAGKWHELRIDCGAHSSQGGALNAARRMLGALFQVTLLHRATRRLASGLQRRLFRNNEQATPIERFVGLLNRAANACEHPLALVFTDVLQADAESLALIAELVGHPDRFDAAVILQYDRMPPLQSPSAAALAQVRAVEGPGGLVGTNAGPNTFAELNPVLVAHRSSPLC